MRNPRLHLPSLGGGSQAFGKGCDFGHGPAAVWSGTWDTLGIVAGPLPESWGQVLCSGHPRGCLGPLLRDSGACPPSLWCLGALEGPQDGQTQTPGRREGHTFFLRAFPHGSPRLSRIRRFRRCSEPSAGGPQETRFIPPSPPLSPSPPPSREGVRRRHRCLGIRAWLWS